MLKNWRLVFCFGIEIAFARCAAKTFRLLYGGIDKKTREKVPFFDLTHQYINKKWNEINTHNCVYTDIYKRKIIYSNVYCIMSA